MKFIKLLFTNIINIIWKIIIIIFKIIKKLYFYYLIFILILFLGFHYELINFNLNLLNENNDNIQNIQLIINNFPSLNNKHLNYYLNIFFFIVIII